MIDLNRQVTQWLEAGIISPEQADLMKAGDVQSPGEGSSDDGGGRIPVIAEMLGYVGAVLAIWAVLFLVSEFWEKLTDWSQAGLFGVLASALFFAGGVMLTHEEPALQRLSSVLSAGSVVALGGALFMVFDPILGLSVEATWTLIGAVAAVVAWLLLWRQTMPAQQIILFASMLTAILSFMSLVADPAFYVYGLVVWVVGVTWIAVARAGRLAPLRTAVVLGAITMLYGAQLIVVDGDAGTFGIILGLATAALFAVAGVSLRDRLTIVLGAIGIFWFVPQAMFHFFGEAFGGMLALFVSGLAIIALAIWFARHREAL